MVKRGYFDHVSPGGKDPGVRISAAGYRASAWGENIAWGSGGLATPKSIVREWMNSEGHRENILRRVFRDSGDGARDRGAGERRRDTGGHLHPGLRARRGLIA